MYYVCSCNDVGYFFNSENILLGGSVNMYKRLDRYIEKMQNMESSVQNKSNPKMWIHGRRDGKKGYIDIANGRLTSDYIRQDLFRYKRYVSNMQQLIECSMETVRYEIIRTEFELRCLKKRLYKARHEYHVLRQFRDPSPQRVQLLREKIALLQRYREETENRLLEIHKEVHLAEETADRLIIQSRKVLEKKLSAYLNGANYYLKNNNIENPGYLIHSL